jgi:hypothetical protein
MQPVDIFVCPTAHITQRYELLKTMPEPGCHAVQNTNPSSHPLIHTLMLQQSQGTLNNDVLEDRSGRNVDGATFCCNDDDRTLESDSSSEVDRSSDGQVIELDDLWDAANALLEV